MKRQYLLIVLIIISILISPIGVFGVNREGFPETDVDFFLFRYWINYNGQGSFGFVGYDEEYFILSILWLALGILLGLVFLLVLRNQLPKRIAYMSYIAIFAIQILMPHLSSTFIISQGAYYYITYALPIPFPSVMAIIFLIWKTRLLDLNSSIIVEKIRKGAQQYPE